MQKREHTKEYSMKVNINGSALLCHWRAKQVRLGTCRDFRQDRVQKGINWGGKRSFACLLQNSKLLHINYYCLVFGRMLAMNRLWPPFEYLTSATLQNFLLPLRRASWEYCTSWQRGYTSASARKWAGSRCCSTGLLKYSSGWRRCRSSCWIWATRSEG